VRIGSYDVHLLTLGRFRMDGGGLFGIVPRKLWQRVYPHVDEENRVLMVARALLVVGDGVVLLADAGLGEKLDEKARSIFCVDQPDNAVDVALAAYGLTTAQVTHFVYTHLHFDHAGGATTLSADGTAKPVFANARHYVQREHLAWAGNPSDKDRASFNPANWTPVSDAGQLEIIEGPAGILPGIHLRPVHGHTPAMQMVEVRSGEQSLVYTIDLFPTAAHLPPHYVAAFDNLPLIALEEKRQLLKEASERRMVLAFGHDPHIAAARVTGAERVFTSAENFETL
jgi:glyoxylase-like metal-dependent hydrolase (beta-lactamase superfamily II)